MQRNKIYSVKTLAVVARELGEDEDWLGEVASEMEPEDGVIRVYGIGEDSTIAFSDDGIESLHDYIEAHRDNEKLFGPRPLT
jgi:hypothetical protein